MFLAFLSIKMFLCIDNKNLFSSHHVIFGHYDVACIVPSFLYDSLGRCYQFHGIGYSNMTKGRVCWNNYELISETLKKLRENLEMLSVS